MIIGAGAAGLMAAGAAARAGAEVTVLERNRQAGRKLLLSGKGRCNVTHQGDVEALVAGFPGNGRFLYGAFSRFGPADLRAFLLGLGVPTKMERGNRVFPESDDASSVRDALLLDATNAGCSFVYERRALELLLEPVATGSQAPPGGRGHRLAARGVKTVDGRTVTGDAVILATGGASYPGTGSTGDGYGLARQAGHKITPLFPSLVPLVCAETWPTTLTGLTLRNIRLYATPADGPTQAELADEFGELLFTHFGVSGPTVLRASRAVSGFMTGGGGAVRLRIDLKPALSDQVLDQRLQRDLEMFSNREFRNSLGRLVPASLAREIVALSGIDPQKRCREVTREERAGLGGLIKCLELTVTGTRGFREAIVTAGGVDVREVSPRTMESLRVVGLYFAGEILDIDAHTGGFNLQAAFSTGRLAGQSAAAAPAGGNARQP